MGMRHVDSGTLVSHIHDGYAVCMQAHPQGHDVPATEGKHALDPVGFEEKGNKVRSAASAYLGCGHGIIL
jgi:hypothetical protein